MGLREYRRSMELSDEPFYALVMAAMRKADNDNEAKLRAAWPWVWDELVQRYHAPGGCLDEGEREWLMALYEADEGEEDE